jgi:hypothetical protein
VIQNKELDNNLFKKSVLVLSVLYAVPVTPSLSEITVSRDVV